MQPDREMMGQYFNKRHNLHVKLVRAGINKIIAAFPDLSSQALRARADVHDISKISEEEYDPYLRITWHHNPDNDYQMDDEAQAAADLAIAHHYAENSHHPEYHTDTEEMSVEDIAEMVADWAALSAERGTSLKGWVKSVVGPKYIFSPDKEKFIYEIIEKVFPELG